jgi:hypothetical protein
VENSATGPRSQTGNVCAIPAVAESVAPASRHRSLARRSRVGIGGVTAVPSRCRNRATAVGWAGARRCSAPARRPSPDPARTTARTRPRRRLPTVTARQRTRPLRPNPTPATAKAKGAARHRLRQDLHRHRPDGLRDRRRLRRGYLQSDQRWRGRLSLQGGSASPAPAAPTIWTPPDPPQGGRALPIACL